MHLDVEKRESEDAKYKRCKQYDQIYGCDPFNDSNTLLINQQKEFYEKT